MSAEMVKTESVSLISQAIDKGATIETLEKLMALQERYDANQARKSFFSAMSKFQSIMPELRKSKVVSFGPGKTEYRYTPLADIARQIRSSMDKCDLSYRWEIDDKGQTLGVTCIVTHSDGHSERTSMTASADASGSKNAIQARGSAITYLQRYTLIGALGISSADTDVDGKTQEADIDDLHKEYMKVYNKLIVIDPGYSKYDPDNWKGERTAKNYVKATGELRKLLGQLIPGEA